MILSLIVAAAENGVIGKDGKMPWRLPAESDYFRATTRSHPVIIGRKNFEAMKRPMPNRPNIVITRQTDYKNTDDAIVVHSLDEALGLPVVKQADEVFVLGGAQIYDEAMPRIDKLYLTIVHAKMNGDTFFRYDPVDWQLEWSEYHPVDAENKYAFTLQRFIRK
jgi:dihydrofolate reductase